MNAVHLSNLMRKEHPVGRSNKIHAGLGSDQPIVKTYFTR